MTATRFGSLADTKTWEEKNIEIPSVSTTSPAAPVISRVRTERSFRPAESGGPTFEGVGVSEYTMVYAHTPDGKPTDPHAMKADYVGIMTFDGTFKNGDKACTGSLIFSVVGRFDGVARGEWNLVKGSVKGDLIDHIEGEAIGGYVSGGMTCTECWIEFTMKE